MGIAERLRRLEAKVQPNNPVDWHERLARYKRWFVDGEEEEPQTEEEKANLARYKRYFYDLEAGVAAPRWDR